MQRVFICHGPNLEKLGERPVHHYGKLTYEELKKKIALECSKIELDPTFFVSNHEGGIIEFLHSAKSKFQGGLVNLGGFSHTSVAIRDAIELTELPVVEVHLSHIFNREEFRQKLVTATACKATITGCGPEGYRFGLETLRSYL